MKKIGILPGFNGISVKDGANLYSKYGSRASQCLSHILRYLKGAYEQNNRLEAKKIADYLSSINDERNKIIASNTTCFKDEEIKEIYAKYDLLISEWETALTAAKKMKGINTIKMKRIF